MTGSSKKTVYFLGAGFSIPAGAPQQSEILSQVLNYSGTEYGDDANDSVKEIRKFLRSAFHLNAAQMAKFSLEDFYTPIDKCLHERSSFRGYSVNEIQIFRNKLSRLISIVIDHEILNSDKSGNYVDIFARYIISQRQGTRDSVSLITTNWDIIVDSRVDREIESLSRHSQGIIDYGMNVVGLGPRRSDQLIPPLVARDRGIYRVKLYKIHGSLNWLKCPSCYRLFTNPRKKEGIIDFDEPPNCRFCIQNFQNGSKGLRLEPQLLFPTFLKDISDIHYAQLWNSVAMELSEASDLVFIGYSFPQADFEIRQLLARKVSGDCKIHVVLKGEEPNENDKNYWMTAKARYKYFFGDRVVSFDYRGVEEYVKELS